MMQALLEDKTEFVQIFLQNGIVLRKFLTLDRLHQLYNKSIKRTGLIQCLVKHNLMNYVGKSKLIGNTIHKIEKFQGHDKQLLLKKNQLFLITISRLLYKMLGRFSNKLYNLDTLVRICQK